MIRMTTRLSYGVKGKTTSFTLFLAISSDEGESFPKTASIPLSTDVATHPEGMPKIAFKKDGSIVAAYEKKATKDDRVAMLREEDIRTGSEPKTVIQYRISKDGVDIQDNMFTPKDVNAFHPVVTKTRDGFIAAYLLEQNSHVGVVSILLSK